MADHTYPGVASWEAYLVALQAIATTPIPEGVTLRTGHQPRWDTVSPHCQVSHFGWGSRQPLIGGQRTRTR